MNRFDAVVNLRNALAVFLKDAHCLDQTPGRAKITESMPMAHESGTPHFADEADRLTTGLAVDPMTIDLVGSDRVRRHSHLRH